MSLPDPALVVLVGASGSGKSTWAASRYRAAEVVSSDALRGVVGSGEHDLDASVDAFALLEQVVAARLGRGLTTVVDTLGTDAARRRGWLDAARRRRPPGRRRRPRHPCGRMPFAQRRPRPPGPGPRPHEPARLGRRDGRDLLEAEGWQVVRVAPDPPGPGDAGPRSRPSPPPLPTASGLRGVVLQLSRFPAEGDLLAWLRDMAGAAEEAGLAGLALMDHLIQIPQVGRAWDPIPEPWVTLGALAAVDDAGSSSARSSRRSPSAPRASPPRPRRRCRPSRAGGRSSGSVRAGGNASTRHTASGSPLRERDSTRWSRGSRR